MTKHYIDGFVPVVEWAKTNPNILKNDLDNISLTSDKIFGVLFNKVDFKYHDYFSDISKDYIK